MDEELAGRRISAAIFADRVVDAPAVSPGSTVVGFLGFTSDQGVMEPVDLLVDQIQLGRRPGIGLDLLRDAEYVVVGMLGLVFILLDDLVERGDGQIGVLAQHVVLDHFAVERIRVLEADLFEGDEAASLAAAGHALVTDSQVEHVLGGDVCAVQTDSIDVADHAWAVVSHFVSLQK